jgi:hypothetical protein
VAGGKLMGMPRLPRNRDADSDAGTDAKRRCVQNTPRKQANLYVKVLAEAPRPLANDVAKSQRFAAD